MNKQVVNILTRTSNRPIFFSENHASVRSQTYQPLRYIVCADDLYSLSYSQALADKFLFIKRIEAKKNKDVWHFPFNLYVNQMMEQVEDGWVLVLDDDDLFFDETSLETIMSYASSEDDLLLWKVQFPACVIPKKCFGSSPQCGDITAIGFMFHSKHKKHALWDEYKESDFRVVDRLYKILNPVWIDQVLTKVNYQDVRYGLGTGYGERLDKVV